MANDDRVYEAYTGTMGENFQNMTVKRINWIVNQAEAAQNVLDIGCSQGIVSLLLAVQGKQVIGVDIQPEAICYAEELLKKDYSDCKDNVHFVCSDFMQLDLNEKFDYIVMTEILEHLEKPEEFLEKAGLLLENGGKLVVSVPFGVSPHHDHKATYYLTDFFQLLQKYFKIQSFEYLESWLFAICGCKTSDLENTGAFLDYIEEEKHFQERELNYINENQQLKKALKEHSEKYKLSLDNYSTAKEWLNDKDKKISELQKQRDILVNHLVECLNDYDMSIKNLEKLKREFAALEVRNQALMQINKEQNQKLDLFRNSRIGKLGIKFYRLYRNIFRR